MRSAYRALPAHLRKFVDHLIEGKTGAEAVRTMRPNLRIPRDLAWQWRHRPAVQAALQERMEEAAEDAGVSHAYVLKTIVETIERSKGLQVITDKEGQPEIVLVDGKSAFLCTFDAKAVLKGAELLGKHLAMFVDKHEVTGRNGGPISLRDADRHEVARRVARTLALAIGGPTTKGKLK